MSNFPHYSNGDRMEEEDLFLYGDKLAILDNITFDPQRSRYKIGCRIGNDLIEVPFDLLENSNIELVKIEGDKPKEDNSPKEDAKYIATFYFDNKETYSVVISQDIVKFIATEGFSKQTISSQDLMFILSPEDNTSVGINLDKITHFEIEERL
jgi:uncharacterized protein (DUF342 family)